MRFDDRRAGRARPTPPTILVRHHPHPAILCVLRELAAGMEEEGVPFRTEAAVAGLDGDARDLSYAAALASALGVGVGVDSGGNICVHHAKLPPATPAVAGPASSARALGHNAARLVTGIPFKSR